MPATADHHARENLDAFLVAFDDFRVDLNRVPDPEINRVFPILFRLNFIK